MYSIRQGRCIWSAPIQNVNGLCSVWVFPRAQGSILASDLCDRSSGCSAAGETRSSADMPTSPSVSQTPALTDIEARKDVVLSSLQRLLALHDTQILNKGTKEALCSVATKSMVALMRRGEMLEVLSLRLGAESARAVAALAREAVNAHDSAGVLRCARAMGSARPGDRLVRTLLSSLVPGILRNLEGTREEGAQRDLAEAIGLLCKEGRSVSASVANRQGCEILSRVLLCASDCATLARTASAIASVLHGTRDCVDMAVSGAFLERVCRLMGEPDEVGGEGTEAARAALQLLEECAARRCNSVLVRPHTHKKQMR